MEAEGSEAGREEYQEAEAGEEENQRPFLSYIVKDGSFAHLPLSCPLNLSLSLSLQHSLSFRTALVMRQQETNTAGNYI